MLKGIDVNRKPRLDGVLEEDEEEEGASSPDSTLSSVSGKRSERDPFSNGEVHRLERMSSRGASDEEDGEGSRKKLRLSKEQAAVLEECFKEHNTLNPKQKIVLAKQLNLRPRQVEVWFQNRRARTKLKQTEVDCEYLKRWCERLTEENRRLQKEVADLRALKLLPPMQLPVNMMPPATLTMCPSCQRVISPSNSSNSSSSTTTATSSSPPANHQGHHLFPVSAYPNPNPWAMTPLGSAYLNQSS